MQRTLSLIERWDKYNLVSAPPGTILFSSSNFEPKIYEQIEQEVRKALKKLLNQESSLLNYSSPAGLPKLRKIIVKKYQSEGVSIEDDNLLITAGSQNAIDLTLQSLLTKGDQVLVENQSYIGLQQPVSNSQARIVSLPQQLNQMTPDAIEKIIKTQRIKLFYLCPDFANPTGLTLNQELRKQLVKLANKYQCFLLEDQAYRDYCYQEADKLPPLTNLSPYIISTGTCTKTIAPGLRIGWLVASKKLIQNFLERKRASSLFTPNLDQELTATLLEGNFFTNHLEKTKHLYQLKMQTLTSALEKYLPEYHFVTPAGGIYCWLQGPSKFKAESCFSLAVKNGVSYVPGSVFYYGKIESNTLRLSVSAVEQEQIEEGVLRLKAAIDGKTRPPVPEEKSFLRKLKNFF